MNMTENDVRQALNVSRSLLKEAQEEIQSLQMKLAQERQENSIQKMARHMHRSNLNAYGNDVDEIVEKLASMDATGLQKLAATIELSAHPAILPLGTVGGNENDKTASRQQADEDVDHWAGFKASVSSIANM